MVLPDSGRVPGVLPEPLGRCGAACGPLFVWVGGLSAPRLIVWWNRYGELTVSLCVGGRAGHGRVPLPPSPPPLLVPVS